MPDGPVRSRLGGRRPRLRGRAGPASRDPSGQSLKRSVSQRPNRPGRRARPGRRRPASWSARPRRAVSVGDGLARSAGRRSAIGSPTLTRTRPPKPQPARAVDRDRDERHAGPQGEVRGALAERQQLVSRTWIRPSPAIATTPPLASTAPTRRVASSRSFLPGLVRDRRPGPGHQPVAAADAPCPPPSARRTTAAAGTAGRPSGRTGRPSSGG